MDRKDVLGFTMSGLALFLSGANIVYTMHKDAKERTENVSLEVRRMLDGYETTVRPGLGGGEFLVRWKGVIANNGTVPIALVNHRLRKTEGGMVDYTGMDAGLFDVMGRPLAFPINLPPGQAMSFVQQTQLLLSKQIFDDLASKHLVLKPVNTRDLMLSLGEDGVDYWGNAVRVHHFQGKVLDLEGPSLSSGLIDPTFLLVFDTARGSSIPVQFSYYGVFEAH